MRRGLVSWLRRFSLEGVLPPTESTNGSQHADEVIQEQREREEHERAMRRQLIRRRIEAERQE